MVTIEDTEVDVFISTVNAIKWTVISQRFPPNLCSTSKRADVICFEKGICITTTLTAAIFFEISAI